MKLRGAYAYIDICTTYECHISIQHLAKKKKLNSIEFFKALLHLIMNKYFAFRSIARYRGTGSLTQWQESESKNPEIFRNIKKQN